MRHKGILASTMAALALASCGQSVPDNKVVVDKNVTSENAAKANLLGPDATQNTAVQDNSALVDELLKKYAPGRATSAEPAIRPLGRYQVVPSSGGAIKVDTSTGETWRIVCNKNNTCTWLKLADDVTGEVQASSRPLPGTANDPLGIRQFLPVPDPVVWGRDGNGKPVRQLLPPPNPPVFDCDSNHSPKGGRVANGGPNPTVWVCDGVGGK